ncbi:glycosyltransferase [Gordonia Phage JonJames]|nr:glycosyltransferase [Gordonia Phage JonJames]
MKLSILVCSVHTRYRTFALTIQDQLWGQYESLSADDQSMVEIVILTDSKSTMLGEKRNIMVEIAQGDYVVFVDDDDRIAPDYIDTLLQAIKENPGIDDIVFLAQVSINGGKPKICRYSTLYNEDHNTSTEYHRLPNHICCIRRDHALAVKFPSIPYGEDSGWSKELHSRLVHECQIDRVLYYYDYNASTSETQEHKPARSRRPVRPVRGPILDLVILSNAKTADLHMMTSNCIRSIRETTSPRQVNIIVMEQNARYSSYPGADKVVLCPESFHYNKFANRGLRTGSARWVMVANNDLIFEKGWLTELISTGCPVVSPKCPDDSRQRVIQEDTSGWTNGVHFSGWCFMMSREVYEDIGGFDECVSFWCSDDVVLEQLKVAGYDPPTLAPDAVVRHLGSKTLKTNSADNYDDMTWAQVHAFNEHHGQNKFSDHPKYTRWKARNGIRT